MKALPRVSLLIFLLVYTWLLGSCRKDSSPIVTLESQSNIGALSTIRLHFSTEMDHDAVESHFNIAPAVKGRFAWMGETMEFIPSHSFTPGLQYIISLSKGITALNGKVINEEFSWLVEIRSPSIVYLSPVSTKSELWRTTMGESHPLQLTFTGGNVIDFAASRDGETIAFSVKNPLGGEDLWLVDRDGRQMHELVNCNQDICAEPSWSPDAKKIAFDHRSGKPPSESAETGHIWIVDVSSGKVTPLIPDAGISGSQPSWSPDGSRIAYFDTLSNRVGIMDLSDGRTWYLPATTGIVGNWSNDGTRMFFTAEENTGNNLAIEIYEADIPDQQYALSTLNEIHGEREYSVPAWSPDGETAVFAERCIYCSPTAQLWLAKDGGQQLTRITTDERFNNSAYKWDPAGDKIVFQRYQLGSSTASPEIVMWELSGVLNVVARDAAQPAWLP
jgi:Tol biopolymer transport system component